MIEARHRPRLSRAFFPAPAVTPTLFEELQLFISTSIRGHTSFIPATLPPEHASLVPPGRCPEDATSTQRWGSHAGATATGVLTAFFLHVFICPNFKASASGSPWPAADTALRQEIGAAACCLRLPLYAAAFSPRPTCKVCFLKILSLENLDWLSSF